VGSSVIFTDIFSVVIQSIHVKIYSAIADYHYNNIGMRSPLNPP
jgi:hypothetical protein